MQVDAHVHFWKFDKAKDSWMGRDMKILKQDYVPEHISLSFKNNRIDGCVAIQSNQTELQTHFLVELAKTHDIIKGVVGWTDFQNEKIRERLEYFSQYPIIKGWQHDISAEPDDFLLRDNFQEAIAALQTYNYTYDLLISPRQLKPALELVTKFPDQKFVIDHCGKPGIAAQQTADWKTGIKEMARNPNTYCKLSGLFTEAKWKQWSAADFYPYLDVVFEAFGTDRLLFGSDWPVILLSGIYVQWKSLLEKYMEDFKSEEKEKVFGLNATGFYNL